MRTTRTILAGCALAAFGLAASAQALPPPQNVLQLQTSGTVEVQQDLLQMTLSTSRDGNDPAAVQSQLRSTLEAAVAEAQSEAARTGVRGAKITPYLLEAVNRLTKGASLDAGLYGERTLPFVMAAADSIDVDSLADLRQAELALRRRGDIALEGMTR